MVTDGIRGLEVDAVCIRNYRLLVRLLVITIVSILYKYSTLPEHTQK